MPLLTALGVAWAFATMDKPLHIPDLVALVGRAIEEQRRHSPGPGGTPLFDPGA